MIPYGRQDVDQSDIDAVISVLQSDYLTQGPIVPAFETAVSEACGASFAVAVNSATSALHIACLALSVGKGDRVWTTPITFVASANCALYCGAEVDFVDIDSRTYNLSAGCLAEKLTLARKSGKLPKVVIAVHMAGQSCDMASIFALSQQYGFSVIEDASHAVGGRYQAECIGSCRYSSVTVFSFHPVKIITSGEGGMALTNDAHLAKKMKQLRSHGISSDPGDMEPRPTEEIWNYQQVGLGFNYRMTDIHAALGLSQTRRLTQYVDVRRAIAQRYDSLLGALPVTTPWQHPDSHCAFHLYILRLHLGAMSRTQRQVYEWLHAAGILVNLHYIPVYRQPYYEKMGFRSGYCVEAERYYSECLSIPIYAGLSRDQQDFVVDSLKSALESH